MKTTKTIEFLVVRRHKGEKDWTISTIVKSLKSAKACLVDHYPSPLERAIFKQTCVTVTERIKL